MGMRKDGEAIYIVGASRSGKTQYGMIKLFKNIKKYKRIMVWDFNGQWYSAFERAGVKAEAISGKANLANRLRGDKDAGVICYTPSSFSESIKSQFDFFCGAGFIWCKEAPCMIVIEEISSVVGSGAAVGNWQMIQTQMQKYGGGVIAIIQRGQEGDKTTMTQSTETVIFRAGTRDVPYILQNFDLPEEMMPKEALHYCKIDNKGRKLLGKIQFNSSQKEGQGSPAAHQLIEKKIK